MDTTLQTPGTKRVFPMPQGLKELASDISKAVIQNQPDNIYKFIANYINSILLIREKTREAAIIVHDLLNYELTYEKMLTRRGVTNEIANRAATIIQAAFRGFVARKAYEMMKPSLEQFDIELYLQALGIAHEFADEVATKIQAVYRGYRVRRVMWEVFGFSSSERGVQDENRMALQSYLAQLGVTYSIATKAAWKIQRFYRDYRKRSSPIIEVPQKVLSKYRHDSDSEEDDNKPGGNEEAVEVELPVVLPHEVEEEMPVGEPEEGDDRVSIGGRSVGEVPSAIRSEGKDEFAGYATETTDDSSVTDWDGNVTDTDVSDVTDHEE